MDRKTTSDPLRRRLRRLRNSERKEEATAFIRRFHRECQLSDAECKARLRVALSDLKRHRFYELSPQELAFGARMAWRHSSRCIGRLGWESLEVFDCREAKSPETIAANVFGHLKEAWNGGPIRSIISIFAPVRDGELPAYIESNQAIQYAGRLQSGRPIVGDPLNLEITRIVEGLGWRGGSGDPRFEILPLLIRDARQRRSFHELPKEAIQEVRITHPNIPSITDLGLRWYAIPCVSSMIMSIGGLDFPCAPFNGHYMGTEIASRNLADQRRYDVLPQVAECLDIHSKNNPLWKDHALLALNEAVLHSYENAGVRMTDHHSESKRYMDFVERERAEGRQPAGDWSWITPPQAGPSCPVFHMRMEDHHPVPNFYRDRGTDGKFLRPDYSDVDRWRHAHRWDRLRYRWRRWRHQRDGLRK